MQYTFTPSHPGAVAYAYVNGPLLHSGDVVEMTAAQADRLIGIVEGANGGPCLIACDPAQVTAAAEFLAAISTPTVLNPEAPVTSVSVDAEPVKRKPGRPKKDPA